MNIVAVVCSFWAERVQNVFTIIEDLQAGTRPPDRIIVWNNAPGSHRFFPGAETVNCGANYETRAKYVAPLLVPADGYLLMDDDTSVQPGTLALLEEQHEAYARREFLTGYWGVRLARDRVTGEASFANGALVGPDVPEWVPVDAFHGRGVYASCGALVNALALDRHVRLGTQWKTEGDDLLVGLANEGNAFVTPLPEGSRWKDLDTNGVAMCQAPGYFDMRDRFLNDALAIRDGLR